jgi:hypothetical protein
MADHGVTRTHAWCIKFTFTNIISNCAKIWLDSGVKEVFSLNGEEVCTSNAEYHHRTDETKADEGMNRNLSGCIKTMDVKKDDKLSMEVFYDLDLHPP